MKEIYKVGDKVRFNHPSRKDATLVGTMVRVGKYNVDIQIDNGFRWLDVQFKDLIDKVYSNAFKQKRVNEFRIFLRENLPFDRYSAFLSTRCTECNSYYVGGIVGLGEGTIEELKKKAEILSVYINQNCKHDLQLCKTTEFESVLLDNS